MDLFTYTKEMLKEDGESFDGRPLSYPVLESGSYAVQKATELGAKVISLSDSKWIYIIDKDGIDFDLLVDVKVKTPCSSDGSYAARKSKCHLHEGSVWTYEGSFDIALPWCYSNEINGEQQNAWICSGVRCVSRNCQYAKQFGCYCRLQNIISFMVLLKPPMLVELRNLSTHSK